MILVSQCASILNIILVRTFASTVTGIEANTPEGMVNSLAYTYLYFKQFVEDILCLFKLNVSNYPDSWHAYDSLGDYYNAKGDKANAMNNYKKALSIKEVPDTRKKLEAL